MNTLDPKDSWKSQPLPDESGNPVHHLRNIQQDARSTLSTKTSIMILDMKILPMAREISVEITGTYHKYTAISGTFKKTTVDQDSE